MDTTDYAAALAKADESGSRYTYWALRTWQRTEASPNPPAGMLRVQTLTWPAKEPDNLAAYADDTRYVWPADVAEFVAYSAGDAMEWGCAGTVEVWTSAVGTLYPFGERLPIA